MSDEKQKEKAPEPIAPGPMQRYSKTYTEDVAPINDRRWEDFGLKKSLLRGIYDFGWEVPSPVQSEVIPLAVKNHHILARAKNGTGKTGAFVVPCLQRVLIEKKFIQVIIIVPTRELAFQHAYTAKMLSKYMKGLTIMAAVGGTAVHEDILRVKSGVHIVVCTLGRMLHLIESGNANVSMCHTVVLDETDRLLTQSFAQNVEELIKHTHKGRKVYCLSASFPRSVEKFKLTYMPNAQEINLMDELTLKGITQYYAYVPEKKKVHCLASLFKKLDISQAIIFCNSIKRVELLTQKITKMGSSCLFIHSGMTQKQRLDVFHNFRFRQCRNLVCTDIFGRGIDSLSVNVVINFDFPLSPEKYLHRIGRSGRYGQRGLAINFVTDADKNALYQVEKQLGTEIEAIPKVIPKDIYT